MNYQTRAFQLSFLLHSVLIILAVIGSTYIGQHKKEIILDFDLQKPVPAIKRVGMPAPAPFVEKKFTSSAIRQNVTDKEAVVTKYLNENFAYIRDRILKNVSYPDTARRKGWEGKVVLSFVIMANGSVKAFKIIQSSGFTVLDKSAIETVRDTAPFPRPPGEAQLVIPITYQLE